VLSDRVGPSVLTAAVPLLAGGGCHGHSGRPRPPEIASGPQSGDYTEGMRRGRSAGIATALAIAATAAVTAGCGGGSNTHALAFDPVSAAVTKTQDAGAARIRFALAMSGPELHGKTLRLHGAGAIDGTSADLNIKLGSLLRQANLPPGSVMREILLEQDGDYVIYVQLGALSSHLPSGKQWIELDLSKLGKSAGIDLGKLMSGSQLQPGDLLSMLKAEGAEIRKLGPATVEGSATTRYRVTIDVAKALQAKGLTSPLLAGVGAQMPKLPADVWIGADGLVHQIRISYGYERSRVGITMNLYDYGAHVTIQAPLQSDVFDATALAQQGLASSFQQ
jgi:hypothetical protein